ncbi:ricin-type beta-trefoil lectin protein [Nocardiopsis sp. Huas11]|uniref:RICIN domain-containing protein n=1 Tax=Nocardiopsis sp. Huas11 TaxID=2183912 RepID=UPI000EB0F3D4|nr:RICIN domain-containing protein [Nocardiopsis sp. Huas11]RKS07774.1 ricin-type beta-trefoil lectin protein [Nocardiopsis sp. Huas11]
MSRRRARVPRTHDEAFAPRWPLAAGATALLLIALIVGYVSGRFAADSAEPEESALIVQSGILVQPSGGPEEEAEPEEDEEEEPVHPAGIDPERVYVLQNVHGDRVLDVAQAATANGAATHLWDRHDQENQQWRFVPVDDGYYEIEGVGSGKVLEIAADGPGATLLTRTGDPHQHWAPVEVGDGVVRLVNRATSQALEAQGGAPDNGTAVVQAPDGGHAHQQWRLLPLG